MSEHNTDTSFECGDGAALVAYLYDECEPRERDAIAAHVATCPACADEMEALGATRRMLPAWAPPEAPLGFQVTSSDASAHVLRSSRWWQRPLPAWAQAAAAVAIFAAGLSAGRAREASGPPDAGRLTSAPVADVRATPSTSARAAGGDATLPTRTAASAPAAGVSPEDLARLERDLRAELTRIEQAQRAAESQLARAASVPPNAADAVTLERVEALIQQSERRQRGELIQGMAQVLGDVENRQLRYLAPIQRTVEGLSREAATNRSSVAALANVVSIQSGFRPVGGR